MKFMIIGGLNASSIKCDSEEDIHQAYKHIRDDNLNVSFIECDPEEGVLQVKKRIREECAEKPINRIEIIHNNLNFKLKVYDEFGAVVYFTDGSIKSFQVLPDPNFHADRVYKENTPLNKDIFDTLDEVDAVLTLGAVWNYAIRSNAEYVNLIFKLPNPLLEDIEERTEKENEEFLEAWMR